MEARLKAVYRNTIAPQLIQQLGYSTIMQVPKIEKITLNMGLGGDFLRDKKLVDNAVADLALIAGQRPLMTKSRSSIAGFKIREGWPIGCKVTLRSDRMYDFLERLITMYLPRVRDFRGLSGKSFDGRGNYSFGIKEHIVCPEIDYAKVEKIVGFDVCITTSAQTDDAAKALLLAFNVPIRQHVEG